jgi:hypothetical protein
MHEGILSLMQWRRFRPLWRTITNRAGCSSRC